MDIFERIGFRITGFIEWNLEDAFRGLSESGFKAVELCLEHPDLNPYSMKFWNAVRVREALREYNLKAASISYHGKKTEWSIKERLCSYGMKFAADLGVQVFISGSHIDPDSYSAMSKFTGKMCSIAEDLGICFAVEPEPETVIEGTPEMRRLMEEIRSPALKINLDIGHSYITSEKYLNDIHKWGNDIVQVHIDDIKNKIHKHLSPGKGGIDFKSVFNALNDIGYRGFYVIDLFDIKNNPVLYAKKSLRDLKGILHKHD